MAINIDADLLPYQYDFFDADDKFYDMLFGGYGSGKTYVLVMKLLKLAAINRGLPGGILSPTTKMFKRDVLPTFKQICREAGMYMRYKSSDGVIEIPALKGELWVFHGEDDGESIRGPNLAYGGVNEVTLVNEKAFDAFLARIRVRDAKLRQLCGSGTPEGFNWTYNRFVAEPRKDSSIFYGDMRLNKFVAEEYAQILTDAYDDVMQQQYVGGKFVNTTRGSALNRFSRAKHVRNVVRNPTLDVWVSMDFNVSPFAATLWQVPPATKHIRLQGFDEIKIESGDTWEMCAAVKDKVGTLRQRKDGSFPKIVIFPDPQGNQRRTSSKDLTTDIDIVEQNFEDVRYNTNVSVRECLIAANRFTRRGQMEIDPKCKETIKDFEQCTIKPGTNNLDKKDLKRTHWLDGYKNMIEHEWPVITEGAQWRTQQVR